jgi:hypothetical protein
MPPTKSPASRSSRPVTNPAIDAADGLLRSAVEACRQHERVGRLIELGCADEELQEVAELATICNKQLATRTAGYETAAAVGKGDADDTTWHAANVLWHASREYARRQASCDSVSTKLSKHSSDKFGELHLEYELEASAILALRQSIAAYRKLRPSVE